MSKFYKLVFHPHLFRLWKRWRWSRQRKRFLAPLFAPANTPQWGETVAEYGLLSNLNRRRSGRQRIFNVTRRHGCRSAAHPRPPQRGMPRIKNKQILSVSVHPHLFRLWKRWRWSRERKRFLAPLFAPANTPQGGETFAEYGLLSNRGRHRSGPTADFHCTKAARPPLCDPPPFPLKEGAW